MSFYIRFRDDSRLKSSLYIYIIYTCMSCVSSAGGTFNILSSPSQLGRASDANIIVIAGSELDTGTTTILNRELSKFNQRFKYT